MVSSNTRECHITWGMRGHMAKYTVHTAVSSWQCAGGRKLLNPLKLKWISKYPLLAFNPSMFTIKLQLYPKCENVIPPHIFL